MKPRESASERRARSLAERIRERELEEQQRREVVIAEFGGRENPDLVYALVDVILRYRFAVAHLADAIGWMQKGTPFITMRPIRKRDDDPGTATDAR